MGQKKIFYLFLFWMILSMGYQNCGTQFQTSTDALSSEDISSPKKVTIQISSPSAEVFESDPVSFVILYGGDVDASTISLNTNQILLGGSDPVGCEVLEVTGEGVMRSVAIGNCSGTGTVNISVSAGTARSVGGELAPSFGPSESFSVDNTEVVPPSEVCPENYILVPALAGYTAQDFCVAKYEMKSNSGAKSEPAGNPWVSINRDDSRTQCTNLGGKYDLISNNQWQTIARNIEQVPSNWSGGAVGNGKLARGWSANSGAYPDSDGAYDSWTNSAVASSTGPACLYNTGANACNSTGTHLYRRTHTLTNGKEIWDFSGNVWEWTRDNYADLGVNPAFSTAWQEIFGLSVTNKGLFGPANGNLKSNQGIGQAYYGLSAGGAVLRGGSWPYGAPTGVFAVHLGSAPSSTGTLAGFRCVFVP